jgi:hypothetical protein
MQPKKPPRVLPRAVHRHLARLCAEADFFFADFIRGSILIVVSWCGESCSGDYPQFFSALGAFHYLAVTDFYYLTPNWR